ncbi:MAG: helix-turn-helix domain-containing protein [Candidatus Acidiferrales bacterium]
MPGKVTGNTTTKHLRSAAVSDGEFLTCKEVAALLRMSEISIRRFLTRGTLKRYKCGARTLIRRSEAMGLIREA